MTHWSACLVIVGFLLVNAQRVRAELITNGGFEAGGG